MVRNKHTTTNKHKNTATNTTTTNLQKVVVVGKCLQSLLVKTSVRVAHKQHSIEIFEFLEILQKETDVG